MQSHPQAALARQQQSQAGAVVAFEVKAESSDPSVQRERAWRVIDSVRTMSITANLGDTRSTITHPATTTHGRIAAADRERAGINEALIRIAVGLESVADLKRDLAQALAPADAAVGPAGAPIDHKARAPYNSDQFNREFLRLPHRSNL